MNRENNGKAIIVSDLKKDFDSFTAVNQISFENYRGEIFGFLGPNGSGKTTTIRMMLGLLKPTSGSVEVLGVDMSKNPEQVRSRVGYMSQRFSLYNDLTVLQNLNFYGKAYGLENSLLVERIQDALQMAGLEGREHTLTRDLSGGWRQRLALSAAILHRPELIFLDEPTAGVDPVSRRAFWDLLYHLAADNITVFVTTHYMDEAEHCHRLAFIQRGSIIARGTPQEIKNSVMDGQILEMECENAAQAVSVLRQAKAAGRLEVGEIALYGALLHVTLPGRQKREHKQLKRQIQAELQTQDLAVRHMDIIQPSLEDVFIVSMR